MGKASLSVSRLSNGEFSRLVTSLLRDWQASRVSVEDTVLTKLKTRLSSQSELFLEGLASIKSRDVSDELEEADKVRDQDLQLLHEMVKLSRYARTAEEKEAYKAISPLVKEVPKAKRSGYEEESAYINRLLTQLKKSEYQAYARTLNLTKQVQAITKSQEAFEGLLLKRHNQTAAQVVYDNKAARKALQDTYQRLGDYLYIMSEETNTTAYDKLYKIYVTNNDFFKPLVNKPKSKAKEDTATPTTDNVSES